MYLLSCFYEEIIVCKPLTSRIANSEKYIVCKGFYTPSNYNNVISNIISSYNVIMEQKKFGSIFKMTHNMIFINDFKFFYGVGEYAGKSAAVLFEEANPFSLERHEYQPKREKRNYYRHQPRTGPNHCT